MTSTYTSTDRTKIRCAGKGLPTSLIGEVLNGGNGYRQVGLCPECGATVMITKKGLVVTHIYGRNIRGSS